MFGIKRLRRMVDELYDLPGMKVLRDRECAAGRHHWATLKTGEITHITCKHCYTQREKKA